MTLLLLSDIHGNLAALKAVLDQVEKGPRVEACVLLGDLVDYGMHSNEVLECLRTLPMPVLCNIRGNHEDAILSNEYGRFSSERGRQCCQYTRTILTRDSWKYLREEISEGGSLSFAVEEKCCYAVHGSFSDEYWGTIRVAGELPEYMNYDYVFSGHSHRPHFVEKFYPVQDPVVRNHKKTVFINPGSVGQPRNLNNRAQYALLNTENGQVAFCKTEYDIKSEQNAFCGQVDGFYRERLEFGI